jgi:pimeloyl-ACP methyl ester carboxylesterase
MTGQMYVESITPERVTHPYPLVFIHGLAQTAVNWMETPDGREGWADWFAAHGWKIYMVDQVARGRSAWNPDLQPKAAAVPVALIEKLFTDPQANPGLAAG